MNILQFSKDELKLEYLSLMVKMGFCSCINDFTRMNNESRTTIDHIFVKCKCIDNIMSIILESCTTEHYNIILIDYDFVKNNKENTNTNMNINIKLLSVFLVDEKWEDVLNEKNVNSANKFHNILNKYVTNLI